MSYNYNNGSEAIKYKGSYQFIPAIKVVVNGVTFWVEDDCNWFYFKSSYISGVVRSWSNENEQQQVIDALLAAHKQGGYGYQIKPINYAELEALEKAGNWKMAFWVLLAAFLILFLMWK